MPGRVEWLGTHLPLVELAKVIARSRICVNIHQDDGQRPINPLFFAIPACGACMVTDDREYLGRWMKPEVEFLPASEGDFVGRVEECLRDTEMATRVAARGCTAAREHAYSSRVAQILSEVGFEVDR
jgi:hypothetical protein